MALVDGAAYERAMAEVERLTAENERLHFDYGRLAGRKLTEHDHRAWRMLADELAELLTVFAPVVALYLNAFEDGELMTLPEKLRLQEVEDANEKVEVVLTRYREARGR